MLGQALAKALARFADFAAELSETFHRDIGLEVPKRSASSLGALGDKNGTLGKRKRPAVDPKAPKKPKTAYILYSEFAREQAKNRGEAAPQMTKLGEEWSAISEADKAKYVEEAEKLKEAYIKEMEKYKAEAHDGDDALSNSGDVPPP